MKIAKRRVFWITGISLLILLNACGKAPADSGRSAEPPRVQTFEEGLEAYEQLTEENGRDYDWYIGSSEGITIRNVEEHRHYETMTGKTAAAEKYPAVIFPDGTIAYPEETEGETVPGSMALTEANETDGSEDGLIPIGAEPVIIKQ